MPRNTQRSEIDGLLPGIQWEDFPGYPNYQPYSFQEGLIYEDTFAQKFLLCLAPHTLSYPNYPAVGAKFALIRVPTLAFAEKIRTDLTTALANAPAKLPRYYGTNSAGQQFTGDTLNSVAGNVGNYGGRILVNVNGALTGDATVRYGNILYGNGYTLNLAGNFISLARDATITDYSLSNGMISLYGTGGHTLHNTPLHNVSFQGGGGQAVTLTNCPLSCDAGFVLFRDGISVTLVGTASTPNPAVPVNAVVPAGVTVTIVPYMPAGTGGGSSVPDVRFDAFCGDFVNGGGPALKPGANGFNLVPIVTVTTDTIGGFNPATHIYTIGVRGNYVEEFMLRHDAGTPADKECFASIDAAHRDSPKGKWEATSSQAAQGRTSMSRSVEREYQVGDQVRMNCYQLGYSNTVMASMYLRLTSTL